MGGRHGWRRGVMGGRATGSAMARVALAGNPSDGYGGRTLAVTVCDFAATATAESGGTEDRLEPPGPGGAALMAATLARLRSHTGTADPIALSCETTVPREVGLAGSSAIVIACARAFLALHGISLAADELARLALAVETEDLGIAAGLQDRIVQSREALVAMDFGGEPSFEELDPALLPPLFVAWHPDAAAPSGIAHAELKARHAAGDPHLSAALARLADLASEARRALIDGSRADFAATLDASFDERRGIMPVDEHTAAMVEVARSHGAAANSAGSGGAIVGTLPGADTWTALERELRGAGAQAIRPRVGRAPARTG
jgi:mevalonate kinase